MGGYGEGTSRGGMEDCDAAAPIPRWHRYVVEVEGKVLVRSPKDPDQLCADICARISEHVRRDEDILMLEVSAYTLPDEPSGS